MASIEEIKAELLFENKEEIVTFFFETNGINEIFNNYKNFFISPLPINLDILKRKKINIGIDYPKGKVLRCEFSFEDIEPSSSYEINLSQEDVERLRASNLKFKKLRFVFRENKTQKIIHELYPYILDWAGVLGIGIIKRWSGKFENEDIDNFIEILKQSLIENGYATGINTEIGFLYKMKGNLDKAIEYYTKEIREMSKIDSVPGISIAKTINNLATVYKNKQDYEKSIDLYKFALNINQNYFEAYISFCGLAQNYELSLKCLARAYIIRPSNQYTEQLIQVISDLYEIDSEKVVDDLNEVLNEIDLSQPFEELKIEMPKFLFLD